MQAKWWDLSIYFSQNENILSHDGASGSDQTPCSQIDKALFSGLQTIDVHYNVKQKMSKY